MKTILLEEVDGLLFNRVAQIRENECIGCTKCIQACPFDTIVGAAKQMHTVITAECTGCGLCVPACPVDCIDLIEQENTVPIDQARQRFLARQKRLDEQETIKKTQEKARSIQLKQRYIQLAVARSRAKKNPVL